MKSAEYAGGLTLKWELLSYFFKGVPSLTFGAASPLNKIGIDVSQLFDG